MHEPKSPRKSTTTSDQQQTQAEDRRTRRRDEGVMSRIEDVTYNVLRRHGDKS